MEKEKIRQTVNQIAAEVFLSDINDITDVLKAGDIEAWDSLGHLNLFLAVETRFGVKFTTDEILTTTAIGDLVTKLSEKLSQ